MTDKKDIPGYVRRPIPGKTYHHYKGGLYECLFIAKHSENEEELVAYRSLHYGSYHVRPLTMWFDVIVEKSAHANELLRFELYNG